MPHIRLIGLVLFITTIFLAMFAAATQTTHIHFKRSNPVPAGRPAATQPVTPLGPGSAGPPLVLPPGAELSPPVDFSANNPTSVPNLGGAEGVGRELQFVAVPVVYPLLIAAAVGLGLWFVPAPDPRRTAKRKRRRRRR